MADGLLNKASIILTPTGYKAGTLYNVAPVVEPYEDFDFARASVASRVNSSGLVEMVGRTLGSELVTNGDFATDSDWSTTGTWQISEGTASSTANGSTQYLGQDVGIDVGKTYKITYTVITNSLSNDRLLMSGTSSFASTQIPSAIGPNTVYLTASQEPSSGYDVRFANSATNTSGSISIDNVSVKEIIDTNNIPRISYDSNGENGHILLEPTSTNLITYSEDFTTWTINAATTVYSNTTETLSPSGEYNASKITSDGSNGLYKVVAFSGGDNTKSIFLKGIVGGEQVKLKDPSQTITTETLTLTTDWVRYDLSENQTLNTGLWIDDIPSNGIYMWGAQLEALPYATSYIPTLTGSTETRATETATGAGSADLINSTEGVLYAEIAALDDDLSTRIISLSDQTDTNRINLFYFSLSNGLAVNYRVSGSTVVSFIAELSDITNFSKVAFKWQSSDFKMYVDGVLIGTNTNTTMLPTNTLNTLSFTRGDGSFPLYGKCKALAVFDEALSDDELTQLTT